METNEDISPTAFSARLRYAMDRRGKKLGATALEREFNLRWRGPPISSHAARKWLIGMSVPTQDKLIVLARWLDISEEWLRWGTDPSDDFEPMDENTLPATPEHRAAFHSEELSLQQDWRMLEARNRAIVQSIIQVLLREQQKTRHKKSSMPQFSEQVFLRDLERSADTEPSRPRRRRSVADAESDSPGAASSEEHLDRAARGKKKHPETTSRDSGIPEDSAPGFEATVLDPQSIETLSAA